MSVKLQVVKIVAFGIVLVLVGAGAGLWWRARVAAQPEKLFWQAMEAGMRQEGVTCTIQNAAREASSKQVNSIDLASKANMRTVTTLKQPKTTITTEELITKAASYVRYTELTSTQKNAAGATPDFKDALNVWSKTAAGSDGVGSFARTALGGCVVPLADLPPDKARNLLKELRRQQVFRVSFGASAFGKLDEVSVRAYDVTVQPRPYIDFMKAAGMAWGLKDLDSVDASTYDKKTPEKLKFYINTDTGRFQKISYSDKQHTVSFSDYGTKPKLSLPEKTVTPQELQTLVQAK